MCIHKQILKWMWFGRDVCSLDQTQMAHVQVDDYRQKMEQKDHQRMEGKGQIKSRLQQPTWMWIIMAVCGQDQVHTLHFQMHDYRK